MPAHSPNEVHRLWGRAMNDGDLVAVMDLYVPDATLLSTSGQLLTGTDAIREALGGALAMDPRYELRPRQVLQTGGVALLITDWTMHATGPDGSPVKMVGTTSDVALRQVDDS